MLKSLFVSIALVSISYVGISQETESKDGPRQIGNKWAVKLTPTQLIMGELNLSVEFKTSKRTSMDIDFGPTLSQVGFGGMTWEDYDPDQPSTTYDLYKDGSVGYFGALGFRYYPLTKTQSLNRLYIQPQVKYRVYRTIVGEESGLWNEVISTNTQYKFLFNLGYVLWASQNFGFEFYTGAGLGYREVQKYQPYTVTNGSDISYEWWQGVDREPQILLNFGIKVLIGG